MASALALPQKLSTQTKATYPSFKTLDPPPQPIPPSPDPPPPSVTPFTVPAPPPPSVTAIPDHLPKLKWSTLFASKPRNAGSFEADDLVLEFDGENLIPTEDIIQASKEQWSDYLVGFFLDSPLPFYAVVNYLRNHMKAQGTIDFKSNGNIFFFQFSSMADRIRVLEADPVIIHNKLFIVKPWEPGLSNVANSVTTVPVWIKIFNIPLVAWSKRGISWLATRVGKFLCMDTNTESLQRLEYAKCMVEISSNAPLLDSFPMRNLDGSIQIVKIFYLWKPELCMLCNVFGHATDKCQKQSEKVREKSDKGMGTSDNKSKQQKESIKEKASGSTRKEADKVSHDRRIVQVSRTAVPTKANTWIRFAKKKSPVRIVVSSKEKGKQVVVDVTPPVKRGIEAGSSNRFSCLTESEVDNSCNDNNQELEDGEIETHGVKDRNERENDATKECNDDKLEKNLLLQNGNLQMTYKVKGYAEEHRQAEQIALVDGILSSAFGSSTRNVKDSIDRNKHINNNVTESLTTKVAANVDAQKDAIESQIMTEPVALLSSMEATEQKDKSTEWNQQQKTAALSPLETAKSMHIRAINADILFINNALQSELACRPVNSPEYQAIGKKVEELKAFSSGIDLEHMHSAQLDSVLAALQKSIASCKKKPRKSPTVTVNPSNPYVHLEPPAAYKARPPDIVTDQLTSSSIEKPGSITHVTRSVKKEMLRNLQENG